MSSPQPTTWLNQMSLKPCVCYEEPICSEALDLDTDTDLHTAPECLPQPAPAIF